jgi:hypothetical protein
MQHCNVSSNVRDYFWYTSSFIYPYKYVTNKVVTHTNLQDVTDFRNTALVTKDRKWKHVFQTLGRCFRTTVRDTQIELKRRMLFVADFVYIDSRDTTASLQR